jgi:hypothetical protein
MRKLFLVGICLIAIGIIGCSKGSQEVEAGEIDCDSKFGQYVLNKCDPHPKAEEKIEAGVGVDVALYKSEKLHVDQENKLNLNGGAIDEGDFSTYTVFKPQLEEGILQTAWKKLKALFNRG